MFSITDSIDTSDRRHREQRRYYRLGEVIIRMIAQDRFDDANRVTRQFGAWRMRQDQDFVME